MSKKFRFERLNPQSNVLPSIAHAVGETPLVDLSRLVKHLGGEGHILAKCEYLNPGFSKKDRPALQMIIEARENGELKEGQTVVERTSGNTGTGLAIACATLGHPFIAVISKGNSIERVRMMKALGAKVVRVDQAPGSKPGQVTGADQALVVARAKQLVEELGAFRPDQFNMPGIITCHFETTGPEIMRQSGGNIDAYCDFIGSGGWFGGLGKYLQEQIPGFACYGVEPEGAEKLAGKEVVKPTHVIQGGGYGLKDLMALEGFEVNGYLAVSDERATACTRALAKMEGIFAGFSSGANVAAALELLKGPHKGGTILVVVCDSGLKYLSTKLWN
ncbi:MAG: cysteine synthase family protein [Sphingomonadales bacterium]